ncbi:hypothetical protein CRG98_012017 [Punica granatum]|uniref:Uncharacterized protein n=1 Tax=Punica granatum TaxID=22663 RepID=A0A2I0KGF9_PUNGR|nr:hypothetical protein CRG98_012017 [Punica granatum]
MISLTLRVVGNEWCEAQTSTFHRMRSPRRIPFNRGPFSGSGLTRETKRSLERRSETCSMVLVVLRCVRTCFRVPFTCQWIGPPGALLEKGVRESLWGASARAGHLRNASRRVIGHFGTERDF